jgi:hypothetical protein
MSEDKGSANTDDKGKSGAQDEFVPKKAYVEVSEDMHKFKNKLKETEARLNEAIEKEKSKEQEKLASEKRFQELYEAEKKRADELFSQKKVERQNFLNATKRSALLSEIGSLEKPEYVRFANLEAIEVKEDGEVELSSLKKEAERFKQEHSALLKKAKVPMLPNQAPMEQKQTKELKGFADYKAAIKAVITPN